MLCPEIWHFKAPKSTFTIQKTDQLENTKKTINSFSYSHLVSTILPDTFKVHDNLTEALNIDCGYYKVDNFVLSDLVRKEFLAGFIECGSLYVLSINTKIDCDNCICLTPTGHLILSLNKTVYQSLGLEGEVSHFHTKSKERYIVKIDLKQLRQRKSYYGRVKQALDRLEKFTIITTWTPPNEDICPSSPAKYFNDLGYKVKLCQPNFTWKTHFSVKLPSLDEVDHHEFVEWLGMLSVNDHLDTSAYIIPEPNRVVGQIKCLQWRGFFTKEKIENYWKTLEEFKSKNNLEWVTMYVQGFSDSPVAWGLQEHHYYTNGDNGYIIIRTKDGNLICKQECSRKCYRKTSI